MSIPYVAILSRDAVRFLDRLSDKEAMLIESALDELSLHRLAASHVKKLKGVEDSIESASATIASSLTSMTSASRFTFSTLSTGKTPTFREKRMTTRLSPRRPTKTAGNGAKPSAVFSAFALNIAAACGSTRLNRR